MKLIGLT
jgi:hypothetical protein